MNSRLRHMALLLFTIVAPASCGGSETTSGAADEGGTGGAAGSTGAGGAAGSSGTGGGAGASGTGGSGGSSETCTSSHVTFQMIAWRPDGGVAPDYCAGKGCGGTWLSLKTAAGEPIALSFLCGVNCDGCSPVPCPPIACFPPVHLPPEGTTQEWDGTYFATATCGAATLCEKSECAVPGSQFVATMCVYPSSDPDSGFGCTSNTGTPNCVDVPFDYPAPGPVVGTIYPTR
jgi:hypothetical protein